jgi:putative adhesin
VSVTEDVPVAARSKSPGAPAGAAAWWWLVTVSVVVLAGVAATLAIWWAASRETRTTSYRVLGDLTGIRLDLGDADVEIDGGATAVEVRRVDRFAYGAPSRERHPIVDGTLTITSRCPDQVLGSCRASYRLAVPDNVPLDIKTRSGSVSLTGVRSTVTVSTGSGAVSAAGFCGFQLRAYSDSGSVRAFAECSADHLELRSRAGSVRAVVPAGRYQIDAQSDSGAVRVRGLTNAPDAPFQVQALSTSGDVSVEAAS